MTQAIDVVHYEGVFWRDIDWTKKLHSLGPVCDRCDGDGAEGHENGCPYLHKNQQSPAGRTFLRNQIREAVERELARGNDVVAKVAKKRKKG